MSNDKRLLDRVALVTGGGSGIGAAAAMALAAEGARVVVADLNAESAAAVAQKIGRSGAQAIAVAADVANRAAVARMVEEVVERLGTVDILVCAAGVGRTSRFEEIDEAEWDLVLNVNLKGPFLCCQAVLPAMKARRRGKIVIIASLAGRATSTLNGAHYSASKAGVLGLARHLAREAAPYEINVNAINPGIIDTPMARAVATPERLEQARRSIPFGRLGLAEEVADLVLFLASDQSAYIKGAAVDTHGGELII